MTIKLQRVSICTDDFFLDLYESGTQFTDTDTEILF